MKKQLTILFLSTLTAAWGADRGPKIRRSPLTEQTFEAPAHLDKQFKNNNNLKQKRYRSPLTSETFKVPLANEREEERIKNYIVNAITIDQKFKRALKIRKSISGVIKANDPLLKYVFNDYTTFNSYVSCNTIAKHGTYTASLQMPSHTFSDLKSHINQKLKQILKKDVSIDDLDQIDPSLWKPQPIQFNYKDSICTFDVIRYLKILKNGPIAYKMFLDSKSANTSNKYGDNIFIQNYLLAEYSNQIHPGLKVLDIGSGAGANAFEALKKGAYVTALDLSAGNLQILWGSTKEDYRQRLSLTTSSFPEQATFGKESQNIILMSHVAHYLSGSQLRKGIQKIHKWLKPGGFFFFQALTPYSNPYLWSAFHADVVADYGQEWPGYFKDEQKEIMHFHDLSEKPNISSGMPNFGHPIHPAIIKRELEKAGFEIVYVNYGSFEDNLLEKYPVSYETLEKYIKGKMDKSTQNQFEDSLKTTYPALLTQLQKDKIVYEKMIKTQREGDTFKKGMVWDNIEKGYRGNSLQSMEIVLAIAVKKDDVPKA